MGILYDKLVCDIKLVDQRLYHVDQDLHYVRKLYRLQLIILYVARFLKYNANHVRDTGIFKYV